MTSSKRKSVACLIALGLVEMLVPGTAFGQAKSDSTPCRSFSCAVHSVFADANVYLGPHVWGPAGTKTLMIGLAGRDLPNGALTLASVYPVATLSWRAELAAGSAAALDRQISGFQLTFHGRQIPRNESDFFGVRIESPPTNAKIDEPRLDHLPQSKALAQMRSNLRTLRGALPPGEYISSRASVVPFDDSRHRFAVVMTVQVRSAAKFHDYIGDAVDGLETGLEGERTKDLVEGTKIMVEAGGSDVLGAWVAERVPVGVLAFARSLHVPNDFSTTVRFPNLTNGPDVTSTSLT
jgi:hypothetical protein